jgi:hypothetical protein
MRMPVLSYFLVVGTILFGVLTLVSNRLAPMPLQTLARRKTSNATASGYLTS